MSLWLSSGFIVYVISYGLVPDITIAMPRLRPTAQLQDSSRKTGSTCFSGTGRYIRTVPTTEFDRKLMPRDVAESFRYLGNLALAYTYFWCGQHQGISSYGHRRRASAKNTDFFLIVLAILVMFAHRGLWTTCKVTINIAIFY